MNKLYLVILSLLTCVTGFGANPSYQAFYGSDFTSNNLTLYTRPVFAISNNITDPYTISDLNGFVNQLKASGYYSNLVDAVLLSTRFNPTNHKSFFGQILTTNGNPETFNDFGQDFFYNGGTAGISLTLPSSVTSNTVFVIWRYNRPEYSNINLGLNYRMFMWSLGNVVNGAAIGQGFDIGQTVFQDFSPGGVRAYGGLLARLGGSSGTGTNVISKISVAGNNGANIYPLFRRVDAYTTDTTGAHKYWTDTLPGIFNVFGAGTPTNTYNPYVLAGTNAMNTLRIGSDTNFTGFTASAASNTNCFMEISAVLVFNRVADSNMVFFVNRAVRWLDASEEDIFWHGDSVVDVSRSDSASNFTNGVPLFYAQTEATPNNCWHMYADAGSQLQNMTNWINVGGRMPITPVSSLPYPAKVKRIRLITDEGRNDTGNLTNTVPAMYGLLTNVYWPYKLVGAKITFIGSYTVWPEAGGLYSMYFFTNLPSFLDTVMTNCFFDYYVDWNRYVSRTILTNLSYSTDATHLNGLRGNLVNATLANLIRGFPWKFENPTGVKLIGLNSGQRQTNDYTFPVLLQGDAVITTAGTAVNGNATLAVAVSYDNGITFVTRTNAHTTTTIAVTAAATTTYSINSTIPGYAPYYLTNLSTGVGNTAAFNNLSLRIAY